MCGLAGFIGIKKKIPKIGEIKNCKFSLKRRGPDTSGVFRKNINNKSILLIHTRLSVVDLNRNSSQPFSDSNGTLVFNGMIYNYIELKNDLKKKGEKFKTTSDTEVLLKLLNTYQEKALEMIDGMWAFAYLNHKNNYLLLSRDIFGEKPLYYQSNDNNFYFSNSIKALQKLSKKKLSLNKQKVKNFLNYQDKIYGMDNETFFDDIYQFPTSSYLKINLNKDINLKFSKFWRLNIKHNKKKFDEACKEVKKITKDVLHTRTRSDVQNSVLVSGGLDSNTIVSNARKFSKINGYSLLSTDQHYDERRQIKSSEKLNKFKTKFIKSNNSGSLNLLENIIEYGYSPLLTPTALGLGLLCQKIKRDKNRVLLTGIGGDELFCGYYVNFLSHILSYKNNRLFNQKYSFWKKNIKKFIRNPNLKNLKTAGKLENKYRLNFFIEENANLKNYTKKFKIIKISKIHKDIFYNNMLQNIFYQSLPAQLFQSDYVCMYFSIENRSPFLSKKLFEYTYKLNKNFFMYNGIPKAILRKSFKKNFPLEIRNNYEKTGFYSPFRSFFKKKDIVSIKRYLFNSKILKKTLNMDSFKKLLLSKNVLHSESKFIFACLNVAILEKLIKE